MDSAGTGSKIEDFGCPKKEMNEGMNSELRFFEIKFEF